MGLADLLEVTLTTASMAPQKVADIPASVVIVTRRDIELYGYTTLAQILESIPGLYGINDYGATAFTVGVRGFWSSVPNSNTIVMVNGVRQVYDYDGSNPLSRIAVPVEAIDRIEVVWGPMSVMFGSGAFYGAINVMTNEFPADPQHVSLTAATGSAATHKLYGRLSGRKEELAYTVHASVRDTDGIDQPLRAMVSRPEALPRMGVPEDHRTGGRLEEREVRFGFSGQLGCFEVELSHSEDRGEGLFLRPAVSEGSVNRLTASDFAVNYRRGLSGSLTLDAKLVYNRIRFRSDIAWSVRISTASSSTRSTRSSSR